MLKIYGNLWKIMKIYGKRWEIYGNIMYEMVWGYLCGKRMEKIRGTFKATLLIFQGVRGGLADIRC